ncbi:MULTISPECIES: Eco57I restriction-modification methylase domain-containing protein [Streptomyces]|uniref:Eco57I restriction-modification methylase domain-containing protein n=1 Tax=Streptomyces TaxID=1883 RepID=UPI0012925151|nr:MULTISPECIES: DNA methyltransferase [Streptomyces]MCX5040597.1 N-6 DNA methylase [Streptomyces coelicoflavus]QFX80510.1 N-6 DNA methylase [Streptomyces sp. SYP-A7193]
MSATTRHQVFTAVHTVGGLLPSDMLLRISEGKDVPGSKPADYGLPSSRSVRDEAERSWEYLKPLWRDLRKHLPEDRVTGQPATDPTGRAVADWLAPLWRELGFGRLTPIGTEGVTADSDTEKHFQVSHRWQHALIHQTPWNANLDKRPGGAGTVPPQSMLQECLNRTEAHLWGLLTNGRQVRLLRDSSALATASYVEFDLEAIFDGELFSEFVLLYRLLHVSRFEVAENAAPSTCWLEKWRTEAIAQGTRALDQLRKGVQRAITTLGTGFLKHPANRELRETVDVKTFHYGLLRMVYRLLFLFVAEDREVLLSPSAEEQAKDRYKTYLSSARLRRHAHRRRGTAHGDLYRALRFVLSGLGNDDGLPELGLPGLGGIFDDTEADKVLHSLSLSNEPLLEAVRALSIVRDTTSKRNRVVDYRHLDAEELGSIYESLLELIPQHNATERTFELVELAGNARKTTGSYYTPSSLIECLLDSALDPVIDDAVKRGEIRATRSGEPDARDAIESELLSLTVCDPACGSGHFLVAAARRIAKRLAAVREQNPEPTIDAVRHALHEVVARCIYGVDLNPMAVELAKVSLWLEALEPGKPLGFLDAHIKHGNALIGATPALLAKGIPDDAFKPIEGDDKKVASAIKKRNAAERGGQLSFHTEERIWVSNAAFAASLRDITATRADSLRDVRLQSSRFRELEQSAEYLRALHIGDAWCAAFVWPKVQGAPTPVTEGVFRDLQRAGAGIPVSTNEEIIRLANQYRFFHWHLEFPEVFAVSKAVDGDADPSVGWDGGFSCVLGNPPWERIKLQEQEFFAQRDAAIANASNAAARKRLIAALPETNPDLFSDFTAAKRKAEGESQLLRSSRRYPLTGRGDINTYAVFTETDRAVTGLHGRIGVIVPTGIATDATTQYFFKDLITTGQLAALYDFENEDKVFPGVHHQMRFCLLTVQRTGDVNEPAQMVFKVRQADQITERRYQLAADDILRMNPNTGTCPVFNSRRDAEITLGIYRRVPVLIDESCKDGNPWGVSFMTMFHMANDSYLFRPDAGQGETFEDLLKDGWHLSGNVLVNRDERLLPLYEAKMLHHYDHRFSTYKGATEKQLNQGTLPRLSVEQHQDVTDTPKPRYWVPEKDIPTGDFDKRGNEIKRAGVRSRLAGKGWDRDWVLGWRDITNKSNERTMICSIAPAHGFGHKFMLALTDQAAMLATVWSSFVLDYAARQSIGGTSMSYFLVRQLPVPEPRTVERHAGYIVPRLKELVYTSNDLRGFAHDLGDTGAPFQWAPHRRATLRAELDAFFFHLYGVSRDDTSYVLDTFNVTRDNDIKLYGSYRTKELILAEYDRMAAADVSLDNPLVDGENYTSTLTPPPGHGPRHPAR